MSVSVCVCVRELVLGAAVCGRPAATQQSDRRTEEQRRQPELRDATGHVQCGQALPVWVRYRTTCLLFHLSACAGSRFTWQNMKSVCVLGADLFFDRHVTGLYRRGASWEVQRKAGGSETFDAVVLTMPVPQILQLEGDITHCETSPTMHNSHIQSPLFINWTSTRLVNWPLTKPLPRMATVHWHLSNSNYALGGLSSIWQKPIRGGSTVMGPVYLTRRSLEGVVGFFAFQKRCWIWIKQWGHMNSWMLQKCYEHFCFCAYRYLHVPDKLRWVQPNLTKLCLGWVWPAFSENAVKISTIILSFPFIRVCDSCDTAWTLITVSA